jgi:hypothetical protein
VRQEVKTHADKVLVAAARKGLCKQLYNARIVAIMHFHAEQGVRLKKSMIIDGGINLTKQ